MDRIGIWEQKKGCVRILLYSVLGSAGQYFLSFRIESTLEGEPSSWLLLVLGLSVNESCSLCNDPFRLNCL